ncbi:hypothetical protein EDD86DRAFT_276974 [Gorgonomyces haynaldii]|nr:hypothetical protein EDD86DRAFT_276974 [Gorgonomyces haynaldii]
MSSKFNFRKPAPKEVKSPGLSRPSDPMSFQKKDRLSFQSPVRQNPSAVSLAVSPDTCPIPESASDRVSERPMDSDLSNLAIQAVTQLVDAHQQDKAMLKDTLNTLTQTKREKTKLETLLDQKQHEYNVLKQSEERLSQDLKMTMDQLSDKTEQSLNLEKKLSVKNDQLDSLNTRLQQLKQEKEQLLQDGTKRDQKLADFHETIKDIILVVETMACAQTNKMRQLDQRIMTLESLFVSVKSAFHSKEHQLHLLQSELDRQQKSNDQIAKESQEAEKAKIKLEQLLRQASIKKHELSTRIQVLEEQFSVKTQQQLVIKEKYQGLRECVDDGLNDLELKNKIQEWKHSHQESHVLKQIVQDLSEKIQITEKQQQDTKLVLEDTKQQLLALKDDKASLMQDKEISSTKIQDLSSKVTHLEQILLEKTLEMGLLQDLVKRKEFEMQEKQHLIASLESRLLNQKEKRPDPKKKRVRKKSPSSADLFEPLY